MHKASISDLFFNHLEIWNKYFVSSGLGDYRYLATVFENHCTGELQQRKQLWLTSRTFTYFAPLSYFLFVSNLGYDLFSWFLSESFMY